MKKVLKGQKAIRLYKINIILRGNEIEMRSTKLFVLVLFIFTGLNLWASETEEFKNQYNDEALRQLFENAEWKDSSEQEDIAYWLYWVQKQKGALREEIETSAPHAIAILEDHISSTGASAERYYRLAALYDGLIFDAPSWMKYNSAKEKYYNLCVGIDPNYKDARILKVKTLLFYSPNAGGDEISGLSTLEALKKEYPEDSDVLTIYADYYLGKEDNEKAKEYYSRVLEQTPNHFQALKNYKELVLIEKNLPIGSISLKNELKTKLGDKLNSVKKMEGRVYDHECKKQIQEIFYSLPSITGVQVETIERENRTVDLSIEISENNMKVYGVLAGIGLSSTYDNTPAIAGFPAFLYMDQNLFGTGNNLTLIFAGIYLGIDLTIPERSGFPFALSFHTDALFIPMEVSFIEDGKDTGWDLKTPIYNASLKLVKETPIGLSLSTLHGLSLNYYEGGTSGFTRPENNITYTGNVELEFSTIESGFPSAFTPPTGFSISVTPTLVFKPDYKSWGPDTNLYTHNDLPGWKYETSIKYYNTPAKRTYLGGTLAHYGGVNLYESEKWSIGQTDMMASSPRLSGYLSGEYLSSNAIVANFDGHFQMVPDKILISAKHDIYYDIDKNKLRQGSALGLALNLPYEIELNIEAGVGWNAERKNGPGWSAQIALSRYFLR